VLHVDGKAARVQRCESFLSFLRGARAASLFVHASLSRARALAWTPERGPMAPDPARMPTRRALVLFGRVGTFTRSANYISAKAMGDPRMLALCATSIVRHVLQPWRAAGDVVDTYVHSCASAKRPNCVPFSFIMA
jgi:hypothetical protein